MTVSAPETRQRTEERIERPDFGFALSASVLLALNAGFINAIGLLSLFNLAVTHITGSTTNLGTALAGADLSQIGIMAMVIASYFAGNVMSGFLVNDEELNHRHKRRYGLVLLVQSFLLVAAIWFFKQEWLLANYTLAIASGLQNGMSTRYSGATVRTSHMSGIVTDLGILSGQRIRGKSVSLWRVQLLSALFAGFLCGGILGGITFQFWGYQALWISVTGAAVAGLSYSLHHLLAGLLKPGAREK